jgi:glycosyltransferase involved in cell wall biosynthesis
MRIAIIGSKGFLLRNGGVEVSVNETASRLAAFGHSLSVYCRGSVADSLAMPMHPNIKLIYLPTIKSKHLETFIHVFLSTIHVCFSGAQVVHFHALGPSVFSFLPRCFGKKTVVTVHGLDWKRKKWGFIARSFLKMCEYPAVYFPHRTIAISLVLKEYFRNKFRKEVIFIPNGAAVYEDRLSSQPPSAKRRYILFVGRLVPEKGLEYLIDAFGRIATDMRLIIAGEHSFTQNYAKKLRASSGKNVDYLGLIQDKEALRQLYTNAYLFVLPSEVEGCPVSLLEAMGAGACVLASDIEEIREIIGDSGFYFRSKNSKDLEEKLRYLIDHPAIVSQVKEKARDRVKNRYNWDTVSKEIEQLYLSLLST